MRKFLRYMRQEKLCPRWSIWFGEFAWVLLFLMTIESIWK